MRGDTCDCGEPKEPNKEQCHECKRIHDIRLARAKRVGVHRSYHCVGATYLDWENYHLETPVAGGSLLILERMLEAI
jgi:hypothetical protein